MGFGIYHHTVTPMHWLHCNERLFNCCITLVSWQLVQLHAKLVELKQKRAALGGGKGTKNQRKKFAKKIAQVATTVTV